MKPPPFAYRRPRTVDEAIETLAEHGDEAKILAGGQSLVPLLNLRLAAPTVLVDVSRLQELTGAERHNGTVEYGAAVVHSAVEDGNVVDAGNGLLRAAAAGIGYRAIRNRGTLGGSLAHADPAAEWPTVMAALDGSVVVLSPRGERTISCRDLVQGFFTTDLEPDELVTAVTVPVLDRAAHWGIAKLAPKPGDFSDALTVAVLRFTPDEVTEARVWLAAAGPTPYQLESVETLLLGSPPSVPDRDVLHDRLASTLPDATPVERRHRHVASVQRALHQAMGTRDEA